MLNAPVSTIKSRLYSGLDMLKEALAPLEAECRVPAGSIRAEGGRR